MVFDKNGGVVPDSIWHLMETEVMRSKVYTLGCQISIQFPFRENKKHVDKLPISCVQCIVIAPVISRVEKDSRHLSLPLANF